MTGLTSATPIRDAGLWWRGHPVAGLMLALQARLDRRIGLALQRRALMNLDARLLADVGISHDEALAEACRPVWDAPGHWRD
jgi:uncharacterized protein YjiS (DUF1127 family)